MYTPTRHKNAWRGKVRSILIGPKAQTVIADRLDTKAPGDLVFTPAEARTERYAAMRAARKSKVTPSQVDRSKKPGQRKLRIPSKFLNYAYPAAIRRAASKAGVPPWHPNQLRHLYATQVRKQFGLEAAQVLLGHSRADVTQVYAERDGALAARVAAEVG